MSCLIIKFPLQDQFVKVENYKVKERSGIMVKLAGNDKKSWKFTNINKLQMLLGLNLN